MPSPSVLGVVQGNGSQSGVAIPRPTCTYIAGGVNACGKVRAGATFFVHYADLDSVAGKAQYIFDSVEKVVGERGFFWAVHLWLNDVDAACAAVTVRAKPLEVMQRAE